MELTKPLACMVLFAGWSVFLLLIMLSMRGLQMLRGERRIHEFPSHVEHGGKGYWRLNRAHLNSLETMPLCIVATLAVTLLHVSGPWIDRLALIALAARVVQSTVHVLWHTPLSVSLRFTAFMTQIACWTAMVLTTVLARA